MVNYKSLAQEYKNGKSIKQLLKENPGAKRGAIYYQVNKEGATKTEPEINQEDNSNIFMDVKKVSEPEQNNIEERIEETIPQPTPQPQPVYANVPRVDSFLGGYRDKKDNSKLTWKQESAIDRLFGDMFDTPTYDPRQLASVKDKPKENSLANKSWSWWSKQEKTPKQKEKEEMVEEENERLSLVQQIRLYFHHFPFLADLHIVPLDKKTNEPDVEKYLISLYTKKPQELERTLHFVKFHTRNQISESSTKIFENVAGTVFKFSEHFFIMCGLKVQGLTDKVMSDEDIQRCLKEIQIEHGVSTINYGPKVDLAINLCSTIAKLDTENRIEDKIKRQQQQEELKQSQKVRKLERTSNSELMDKYKDL